MAVSEENVAVLVGKKVVSVYNKVGRTTTNMDIVVSVCSMDKMAAVGKKWLRVI